MTDAIKSKLMKTLVIDIEWPDGSEMVNRYSSEWMWPTDLGVKLLTFHTWIRCESSEHKKNKIKLNPLDTTFLFFERVAAETDDPADLFCTQWPFRLLFVANVSCCLVPAVHQVSVAVEGVGVNRIYGCGVWRFIIFHLLLTGRRHFSDFQKRGPCFN